MGIEKFKVIEYNIEGALLGTVECPAKFEAEINGNETLDILIKGVIANVQENTKNERQLGVWAAFEYSYARIPYNNKAIDEKNGVAGFVLLNEIPVVGGINIKEGIYGIRKKGKTLRGRLLEYDSNHGGNYFRHIVDKVDNGILKYTIIRDEPREYEFDLKKL